MGKYMVIAVAVFLGACATPTLDIDDPSAAHYDAGNDALENAEISPNRNLSKQEMAEAVYNRVEKRIVASAIKICEKLELDRCDTVKEANVAVLADNDDFNAYADDNNIGMFGGLVSKAGSDDEIAAVLAHEYAHVMHGHVHKKVINATIGTAIGIGIGLAISILTDVPSLPIGAAALGGAIGATAYAPSMEIEADRTAVYILQDAGYDVEAKRDFIIRASRIRTGDKVIGSAKSTASEKVFSKAVLANEGGAVLAAAQASSEVVREGIKSHRKAMKIGDKAATSMREKVAISRQAGTEMAGKVKARIPGGKPSVSVGFLDTHPSDDDRIAHLISAIEDVKAGVPLELSENPLRFMDWERTDKPVFLPKP
jgi:Zn-dependent protease with chaperone function